MACEVEDLKISNLAFSGGGVKGLAFLGAIKALEEEGCLDDCEVICGTSIGSLAALLVVLDASYEYCVEKLTSSLKIVPRIRGRNVFRILMDMGVDDGDAFLKLIEGILCDFGLPVNITLKELKERTGKDFVPIVSSINTDNGETLVLWPDAYPDFVVAQAIYVSSSVPLVFVPTTYCDVDCRRYLADGGIFNNCPVGFADMYDKYDRLLAVNNRTVGFLLMNDVTSCDNISNIKDYMQVLASSMNNRIQKIMSTQDYFWERVVPINCRDTTALERNPDVEMLIQSGYKSTKRFLCKRRKQLREGLLDLEYIPSYRAAALNLKLPEIPKRRILFNSVLKPPK